MRKGKTEKAAENKQPEKIIDYEIIYNDYEMIIKDYCLKHDLKENDIEPIQWLDILYNIADNIIKPNRNKLLCNNIQVNQYYGYDIEKIINIYNIYKRLCLSHLQEVSINDFEIFSTIPDASLYTLTYNSIDFYKIVSNDNRISLEKLMFSKHTQALKFLPKLNRYHGYTMSGNVREKPKKEELSISELPQLVINDNND